MNVRHFSQSFSTDRSIKEQLTSLESFTGSDEMPDSYGSGALIENLERETASLTGKPLARFAISGKLAQQVALRTWMNQRQSSVIGLHPLSHIAWVEDNGYIHVLGAKPVFFGGLTAQFKLADVRTCKDRLAAVVLEMPLREVGGELLPWGELCALSRWARETGTPLHLDGARLWESAPFYQRPIAEIAALFDSIYVSLYKGLGAFSGAVLLGDEAFIGTSRSWYNRHGGPVHTAFPYLVSAYQGMSVNGPQMEKRHERAKELAAWLNTQPLCRTNPKIPHTNMMKVFLDHPVAVVEKALAGLEQNAGIRLCRWVKQAQVPGFSMFEIHVGANTLSFGLEESIRLLKRFLELAGAMAKQYR